jgi:hypothetical protein
MTETGDAILQRLSRLTVLQPDAARSERVRAESRAAIGGRHPPPESASRPRRVTRSLEAGLVYVLSSGYLVAMLVDLLRVYTRR